MRTAANLCFSALLTVLVLAGNVVADIHAPHAHAATTYRIVGTGDSILAVTYGIQAPGGTILTDDIWLNMEHGRQPYVAGMAGWASTASIWPLVLSRSQPGGYIIIQDNGLGTSNSAWRALIQRMVDETPNDRTIVFIPPVFHWWFNAAHHNTTSVYNQLLNEVLSGTDQPYITIPWRPTVLNDMSYVCDLDTTPVRGFAMPADVENHQPSRCDGQHPSHRGQTWLRRSIDSITLSSI
jgi:hypothetical protein